MDHNSPLTYRLGCYYESNHLRYMCMRQLNHCTFHTVRKIRKFRGKPMLGNIRICRRRLGPIVNRHFYSQDTPAPTKASFLGLYDQITNEFRGGNLENCVSLSEQAIQVAKESDEVSWKDVAAVQLNLSHILKLLNRLDDSILVAKRALSTLDSHFSSCKPEVCHALDVVAELCAESDDFEEALKLTDRAMELKSRLYGAHCVQLAKSYNIRGAVFHKQNRLQASRSEFVRALGVHIRAHGSTRPFAVPIGITLSNIAGLLRQDPANNKDCMTLYRVVVEAFGHANTNGNDMWMEGNALCDLAETLQASATQSHIEEARECLTRALHIFLSTRGIDHPSTARATFLLQSLSSVVPKLTPVEPDNPSQIIESLITEATSVVPAKSSDIKVSGDVLFLDRRGHVGHGHPHTPLF